MNKPEMFFKALLLKEYEDRLSAFSSLNEAKVKDEDGNVIIDPELKVRHKDSGFEYTIKKVVDKGGDLQIVLRTPNTPRFTDLSSTEKVIAGKPEVEKEYVQTQPHDTFAVNQKEFEKEYEVD